jgi:hypothetical protein
MLSRVFFIQYTVGLTRPIGIRSRSSSSTADCNDFHSILQALEHTDGMHKCLAEDKRTQLFGFESQVPKGAYHVLLQVLCLPNQERTTYRPISTIYELSTGIYRHLVASCRLAGPL